MFHLYGFTTQNTLKTLYVLEELDVDFEFHFVNLGRGEQRTEEFALKTPIGKVPVLEHKGRHLFESGAICRYVANETNSTLYPTDTMDRAIVDQWIDFFNCHLGRWYTTLYYEQVIKSNFNLGDPDEASIAEAIKYTKQQTGILDKLLEDSDWLANNSLSIADFFAYACVEQCRAVDFSLDDYPNVHDWLQRIDARDSIRNARLQLPS